MIFILSSFNSRFC